MTALAALGTQLLAALSPVIVAGLATVVGLGIHQGVLWIQAHTDNVKIDGAVGRVGDLVSTLVASVGQTLADPLKAAIAGGKLDASTAAKLRDLVVAQVKTLGAADLAVLTKELGLGDSQATDLIVHLIEAEVSGTSGAVDTKPTAAPSLPEAQALMASLDAQLAAQGVKPDAVNVAPKA